MKQMDFFFVCVLCVGGWGRVGVPGGVGGYILAFSKLSLSSCDLFVCAPLQRLAGRVKMHHVRLSGERRNGRGSPMCCPTLPITPSPHQSNLVGLPLLETSFNRNTEANRGHVILILEF